VTPSVLIVEDDADIADTLAAILEQRGYRAETAADGAEALARLRHGPVPSLILLDLMMPVMDGIQFRRAQLAARELASIPVVVLTADAGQRPPLGVAGWLLKPVDLDRLLDTVRRLTA
jgi:CheY-like chemotaxis protein